MLLLLLRTSWDIGEDTCGDLRDRSSDLSVGKRTIATVFGGRFAGGVVMLTSWTTVIIAILIGLITDLPYAYFLVVGVASIPYAISSSRVLTRWDDPDQIHSTHRLIGIELPVIFIALVAFALTRRSMGFL